MFYLHLMFLYIYIYNMSIENFYFRSSQIFIEPLDEISKIDTFERNE